MGPPQGSGSTLPLSDPLPANPDMRHNVRLVDQSRARNRARGGALGSLLSTVRYLDVTSEIGANVRETKRAILVGNFVTFVPFELQNSLPFILIFFILIISPTSYLIQTTQSPIYHMATPKT